MDVTLTLCCGAILQIKCLYLDDHVCGFLSCYNLESFVCGSAEIQTSCQKKEEEKQTIQHILSGCDCDIMFTQRTVFCCHVSI